MGVIRCIQGVCVSVMGGMSAGCVGFRGGGDLIKGSITYLGV